MDLISSEISYYRLACTIHNGTLKPPIWANNVEDIVFFRAWKVFISDNFLIFNAVNQTSQSITVGLLESMPIVPLISTKNKKF